MKISSNPIEDERPTKERKKHDRFNGMPEEEVSKRTIPDHVTHNLDIIIVSRCKNCSPILHTRNLTSNSLTSIYRFYYRLALIRVYLPLIKDIIMPVQEITFGNASTYRVSLLYK